MPGEKPGQKFPPQSITLFVFGVNFVKLVANVRCAAFERAINKFILFGMMQALRHGLDIIDHGIDQAKVGLDLPGFNCCDDIEKPPQNGGDRAVFGADQSDCFTHASCFQATATRRLSLSASARRSALGEA